MNDLTVVVERTIRAKAERVFAAWTRPELLTQWWGPEGVSCPEAHVDLRAGGQIQIANRLPGGEVIWMRGTFESVEPPARLVYTWQMGEGPLERVTVEFIADAESTRIRIRHERIADRPTAEGHERGWQGCIDGLDAMLGSGGRSSEP